MPSQLSSDLIVPAPHKFQREAISALTAGTNAAVVAGSAKSPSWWEVGAARYREMRWNGETALPKPVVLESAQTIQLPSRDSGREIPCRIFKPTSAAPRGVIYYIHGGGWVLQSEAYYDPQMQAWADRAQLTVVSVGYRLAPEHPYPAGNEDCFDIGEYLAQHATRDFGAPLAFISGDSAGAHLSVLTCFHLRHSRPEFEFRGIVLNFGAYDISGFLPSAWHFDKKLILDMPTMQKFIEAYLPNTTQEQRRDPWISPFYADLKTFKLPPALFTVGTEDPLLDDSVLMSAKWAMSGAESILKVYPGAPHGFIYFPPAASETVKQGTDDIITFLTEK